MPPKASRHRWGSDERDVLHILFIEYRLQALGGSKTEIDAGTDIAHALFSELFPWASNERNKVRDQWRTRLAPRRPSTWKSAHEKSLVNYTPEERANRARLRVLIVQAAVNQGIILNPPTLFLGLHNAAKTTALAVGPVTSEEIAAAAASGGSAQTQGSLDLGITVAHTATPSPRKTLAKPRQKDRKLLFSPGEGSRITQTTTKVQKDQIPGLNSNSICMVHRSQVVPFENRGESGLELISRYQCQLDDLMDSTSPVWLAGGPVLRVLVRDSSQKAGRSASNDRQGVLRDVMLCQYGVCFSCNIGSRRAYKPYTTPFVHRKACVVGNGKIIFAPSARARRDQVVNCLVEVEQKLVNYLLPRGDGVEGVKNTPIMSSVCIVRSCAVCRTSTELVPTRKRIGYTMKPSRPRVSSALSSRGFVKPPLASKRPGESLQTPLSKRRYFGNSSGINQRQIRSRNVETGQGSDKQSAPGQSDPSSSGAVNAHQIGTVGTLSGGIRTKPGFGKAQQDQSIPIGAQEKSKTTKPSEPPRRLQMIHRDQLFTNIGNVGPVRPDETKWWTNYGSIFKEGPAWEQGGEAALVLVRGSPAGKFVEWHLMVCNPKYCPDCLPEGSDNGPGPFGGRPFVHTSECERSPQGTSFNPPRNSILIRRETDYARSGPKNVWFSEDGERFLVEALMCDTSRCRFCTTQPASPSGNGGASRENGRDTTPNSGKRAQEDRSSAPPNSGEASQVDGRGFALLEPGRVDDTDATLRMVHYRDLTPNEDEDGFTPDGVPQMTTEHRHIFAAPEKMWRLGGSVMNVLVLETTRNGQHIPAAE
uniref:Uncharacterized protein n=1 Tax=Ramularia collo-cygni TaxID=112498 RepID=A0A2D3VKY5_9PEZI